LNKTNLQVNYVKILQFILEHSKPVSRYRKTWYVINSNKFEEMKGISRTVFRNTRSALESQQMIMHVHIKNKDKDRTKPRKFYSLTPLGLMYLAKNDYDVEFEEELYIVHERIYKILETFLTNSVSYYSSKILPKKLDFSNLDKKLKFLIPIETLHESLRHILRNFEELDGTFSYEGNYVYYLDIDILYGVKIPTCTFELYSENVQLEENLKKKHVLILSTNAKNPQFHNYLARTIVTVLIYDYLKNSFLINDDKLMFLKRISKSDFKVIEPGKIPKFALEIFSNWSDFIETDMIDIVGSNSLIQKKLKI